LSKRKLEHATKVFLIRVCVTYGFLIFALKPKGDVWDYVTPPKGLVGLMWRPLWIYDGYDLWPTPL